MQTDGNIVIQSKILASTLTRTEEEEERDVKGMKINKTKCQVQLSWATERILQLMHKKNTARSETEEMKDTRRIAPHILLIQFIALVSCTE